MAARAQPDGPATDLQIRVTPGASRERVLGMLGDTLRLAVTAPPEDGRANDAVCRFVAKLLDRPRGHVNVIRGATSREKTVRIEGLTAVDLRRWLESLLPPASPTSGSADPPLTPAVKKKPREGQR